MFKPATEWRGTTWSCLTMINGNHHSALTAAPVERASDGHSTPSTSQWLKYTASSACNALRQIPNPTHFLFSAPGRAITLLALAGRGLSCPTSTVMDSAVDPGPGPFSGAGISLLPPPTEPAAELNDQHNPQDDSDIISREKRSPRGGRGGRGGGGGGRSSSSGRSRGSSSSSRSRGWGSSSRSSSTRTYTKKQRTISQENTSSRFMASKWTCTKTLCTTKPAN